MYTNGRIERKVQILRAGLSFVDDDARMCVGGPGFVSHGEDVVTFGIDIHAPAALCVAIDVVMKAIECIGAAVGSDSNPGCRGTIGLSDDSRNSDRTPRPYGHVAVGRFPIKVGTLGKVPSIMFDSRPKRHSTLMIAWQKVERGDTCIVRLSTKAGQP